MRGGGSWALIIGALLLALMVPANAIAADEAALEFGPNSVYSHEKNEFWLTFHNTAEREIVLSNAVAVIDWPGEPWFINQTDPDIVIDFLDGMVTVPAGASVTFKRSVEVGLSGGFSVDLTIRGRYAGEETYTMISGSSSVDCTERQLLDGRAPLASASFVFLFIFISSMFGFIIQGAFYEYEIKKNLEDENLDEFQQFKWFLHIWWRRGHKIWVVLFFAGFALLIALMVYAVLS
ncbi:MAG: hypothetical protein LLG21_06195 [Euryarchaeota archaeon]|jgi:hypothetical protein|nr:hypothetical protein [Euryarchaeota archaeon]